MKRTMNFYKELEAQVNELKEMNLPIEDKIVLCKKLIRKMNQVRRQDNMALLINSLKLYIRVLRMERN